MSAMKGTRHGSATVEFPSDREVMVTRKFDAPAELVFDVLTKPEHVRVWFGAKELEVCEIDFREGGGYHFVGFVMDGDTATCSFRGTYLEIERPVRHQMKAGEFHVPARSRNGMTLSVTRSHCSIWGLCPQASIMVICAPATRFSQSAA